MLSSFSHDSYMVLIIILILKIQYNIIYIHVATTLASLPPQTRTGARTPPGKPYAP